VAGPGELGTGRAQHVRVSDAEREEALSELRDGFADGRLTQDSFVRRVDAVLRARARADLTGLVADLPRSWRLRTALVTAYRHALGTTDRWLRGCPPELPLPTGSQSRFTIGRELDCDMTLANVTVSRWHAALQRQADGWLLWDLGSTNGTRLNGWRVSTPSRVGAGDVVSFGAATFVLVDRPR
jgi:Domain of unknown function (DUF1707)/FHA domain